MIKLTDCPHWLKETAPARGEAGAAHSRRAGREESDTILMWAVEGRFPPILWFRK
jgi:hypothetical protein